jgi:NAD(P)-dependent dehydrogenase (short-subunit alcohol dehydrogenase family)
LAARSDAHVAGSTEGVQPCVRISRPETQLPQSQECPRFAAVRQKARTILITGASQGIGEGLARSFAEEGCNLHVVARSGDRLEALKRELEAGHGVTVTAHALDLTKEGAVERLVDSVGDIDILVNNAGVVPSGTLWDVDEAKWRAGWELKVFGYINLTRALYPRMKARRRRSRRSSPRQKGVGFGSPPSTTFP